MTHPSQPNYIHMIAGTDFGFKTDDDVECQGRTVVDLLEARGLTWATYQENYPGNCNPFHGTKDNLYKRKHNPFMSFASIRGNATRCANIKNADELDKDVANRKVPNYVYFVPNQINDGHGIPPFKDNEHQRIAKSDTWLSTFLPKYLNDPYFKDTLFMVTFDENDVTGDAESKAMGTNLPGSYIAEQNLIYTVLLGSMVQSNTKDDVTYNHHSSLALLEREWKLASLHTGDVNATPLRLSDSEPIAQSMAINNNTDAAANSESSTTKTVASVVAPSTTTAITQIAVSSSPCAESAVPASSYPVPTASTVATTTTGPDAVPSSGPIYSAADQNVQEPVASLMTMLLFWTLA